jgi:hypothetical protein
MSDWWVVGIGLCLALVSFGSLYVAWAAWLSCKRVIELLHSRSTRSQMELSASVTALESSFASLSTTVRKLSSRYGMQERRAKDGTSRSSGDLSHLSGAEWRAAARAKYIRAGKPTGSASDE